MINLKNDCNDLSLKLLQWFIFKMITMIYLCQPVQNKRSVADVQTICWLIISKFEHQHDLTHTGIHKYTSIQILIYKYKYKYIDTNTL